MAATTRFVVWTLALTGALMYGPDGCHGFTIKQVPGPPGASVKTKATSVGAASASKSNKMWTLKSWNASVIEPKVGPKIGTKSAASAKTLFTATSNSSLVTAKSAGQVIVPAGSTLRITSDLATDGSLTTAAHKLDFIVTINSYRATLATLDIPKGARSAAQPASGIKLTLQPTGKVTRVSFTYLVADVPLSMEASATICLRATNSTTPKFCAATDPITVEAGEGAKRRMLSAVGRSLLGTGQCCSGCNCPRNNCKESWGGTCCPDGCMATGYNCNAGGGRCVNANGDCFPAEATVSVVSKSGAISRLRMDELHIGDRILTGAPRGVSAFQDVFMFGQRKKMQYTNFVVIKSAAGHVLKATANHMIYVARGPGAPTELLTIGKVNVGNYLLIAEAGSHEFVRSAVTSKSSEYALGVYAPHTASGNLVVDGVLVSSYSDAVVSSKTAGDMMVLPVRLLYALAGPKITNTLNNFVLERFHDHMARGLRVLKLACNAAWGSAATTVIPVS